MSILNNAHNLWGTLKHQPEYKNKFKLFFYNPNCDTWSEISSIIISSDFKTVWQSVIAIDPTFPRVGRAYDEKDNIIREWATIPTPLQVMQAVKAAQA